MPPRAKKYGKWMNAQSAEMYFKSVLMKANSSSPYSSGILCRSNVRANTASTYRSCKALSSTNDLLTWWAFKQIRKWDRWILSRHFCIFRIAIQMFLKPEWRKPFQWSKNLTPYWTSKIKTADAHSSSFRPTGSQRLRVCDGVCGCERLR